MDTLTRRRFLIASGVVGASALVAGAGAIGLTELLQTASRTPPGPLERKLVLVTLYGGNDGLNTVIPYADPLYRSLRPELAYPAERVLHLDGALGLNPMMPGLKGLWDARRLALVLGVGYPKPDHSHFRSMDIWQTASPAKPIHTGWIGRWLDGTKAPAEAAVSLEPVLPPLLAGETRTGACVNFRGPTLPAGIDIDVIAALGRSEHGEPELQARAALAYADMARVDRLVREGGREAGPPGTADEPEVPATGTGGQSSLAAQLTFLARCVEAGVPTRVYSVSLGGFDTHARERAGHERLLKQLDEALTGFVSRLGKTEAGRQVTVVVYSEFGRRVRGNASEGTDHGTAGPVFVLGPRVAGGIYGAQPSLADLDNGDLRSAIDFRDVFGTVLASVLGAEPARYLDGYQAHPLPLLAAN
jgi:uncharacterized protein (DUF1501 family)